MIKFADQVAATILDESPLDQLHKVRLVLPSSRSISLIKKSLIQKINGSCILPEIATINDFIVSLSDLKKIDSLDTYLTLVKVLQEVDKKVQFNTNIYDLKQLLNDLNAIDNYVINKKEFFQDLNSFSELNNWGFKTNENQKEKNYFSRISLLEIIYNKFRNTLLKKNQGTYAMICNHVAHLEEKIVSNIGKTYFIGLNALSAKEEIIINSICKANLGSKILVDTQEFFVKNKDHEAGHFYRRQTNKYHNKPRHDLFSTEKIISTYEVDSLQQQIHVVDKILKKNDKDVTIVNMDEQFSPYLYNGLAKNNEINFSSGFPIDQFESYKIFKFLCDSVFSQGRSNKFTYDWISELVSFSLITKKDHLSFQKKLKSILDFELSSDKIVAHFPSINDLMHAISSFKESKNENELNFLRILLDEIQKYAIKIQTENDVVSIILSELEHLIQKIKEGKIELNLKEKISLLFDQLSKKRISVIGDQDKGVQLIGLLETRIVDSETIIFTNFNEEHIPGKKMLETNIPKELKRKFRIPSNYEKDALFAYYFYRAIHYPKNIHLLYLSSKNTGITSNEPSRYIHQIQSEFVNQKNVKFNSYQSAQMLNPVLEFPLKQKEDIIILKNWMKAGISSSAINTYLTCSLDFHFKYVLKIKENQKPNEFIESSEWGTAVHNTLEQLFLSYKQIDKEAIYKMKNELEECLLIQFKKLFPDNRHIKGKNKINFYQSKQYILNYLEKEVYHLNTTGSYEVLYAEKEFSTTKKFHLHDEILECCFKGKIDRIDSTSNGLRLIDYKTGYVTKSDLSISTLESIKTKHKALQLLFYAMLFLSNEKEYNEVYANIIALSNTNSPVLDLKFQNDLKINNTHIQQFEKEIQLILEEVISPDIPIFHNETSKFCSFC